MLPETTTASLRALAIQAADQDDRESAEAKERARLEESELCRTIAASRAVQALGEIAKGAEWTALDEDNAVALIGGERFRYHVTDLYEGRGTLLHVIDCPDCGGFRTATAYNLYQLGKLLRDGESAFGRYSCEDCEASRRAEAEAAKNGIMAQVAAERALLDALPPTPSAEVALRTAVKYADRAATFADGGNYTSSLANAATSQAWSAIAREVAE